MEKENELREILIDTPKQSQEDTDDDNCENFDEYINKFSENNKNYLLSIETNNSLVDESFLKHFHRTLLLDNTADAITRNRLMKNTYENRKELAKIYGDKLYAKECVNRSGVMFGMIMHIVLYIHQIYSYTNIMQLKITDNFYGISQYLLISTLLYIIYYSIFFTVEMIRWYEIKSITGIYNFNNVYTLYKNDKKYRINKKKEYIWLVSLIYILINYNINTYMFSVVIQNKDFYGITYSYYLTMFIITVICCYSPPFIIITLLIYLSVFDNLDNTKNMYYNVILKCCLSKRISSIIQDDKISCAICMDEFLLNEKIILTKCNHKYHLSCVKDHIIHSNTKCPLCNISLIN